MLLNDNKNQTFHRIFAKKLLHEWLEDKQDTKWNGDGYLLDFTLIEKLSKNNSGNIVSYNNCYEHPELEGYSFNPTPEGCINNGDNPIMIADIVKVYKGCIFEIFIVYDKFLNSSVETELIKFINLNEYAKNHMRLYTISEKLILKQTKKPKNIYDLCVEVDCFLDDN